jgi:hypothetical protein
MSVVLACRMFQVFCGLTVKHRSNSPALLCGLLSDIWRAHITVNIDYAYEGCQWNWSRELATIAHVTMPTTTTKS